MKVDFLIIGQGLTGTLLAFELIRRKQSFIVINQPELNCASSIAAGIINPVVFKRMTKSWMLDESFIQMESTYHSLEELLGIKFYDRCRMVKILDRQSAQDWKEKVLANHLEAYLDVEPDFDFRHPNINSPYGAGIVSKAGRIDLQLLITTFSLYLEQNQLIRKENFSFEQLEVNPQMINYKDITALKVIFCEGPAVSANPYFGRLKFKHSKGEILEVLIPNLHINEIIHSEVFLMPMGYGIYKVGATYTWDDLDAITTIKAQQELMAKLQTFVSTPAKIINHQAGIRPITHDRKPVIGLHPECPSIGILNGLGSKGALTGPWIANQMAEYLAGRSSHILPEIDVNRYFKIY